MTTATATNTARPSSLARGGAPRFRILAAPALLALTFVAASQLRGGGDTAPDDHVAVRAEPIRPEAVRIDLPSMQYRALPELRAPRRPPRSRTRPSGPAAPPAPRERPVEPSPAPVEPSPGPASPQTPTEPKPPQEQGDLIVQ